jgi:hypothetical protein
MAAQPPPTAARRLAGVAHHLGARRQPQPQPQPSAGVVGWLKDLFGSSSSAPEVESVKISSWAEYPDAQKRADIARCLQLQEMSFTRNPARDAAGFADPNDVRGGDPAFVEGSLGTHVPQWAWDPESDTVPEGEKLDRIVEEWVQAKRDEAAKRMKVLGEPTRRQAANDSRPVGARRSHLGDTRVDPDLQPGDETDEIWHLVRVDGAIVAKSITYRKVVTVEPPPPPGQANQGRMTEPVGMSRRKVEILALKGVATDPTQRRKGYAAAAVGAALQLATEEMEKGTIEFMLFQTGDAWPLYDKLGCARVPKDMIAAEGMASRGEDAPEPAEWDMHPHCPFHDYHVVVHPASAARDLEGSVIDVHGPGW